MKDKVAPLLVALLVIGNTLFAGSSPQAARTLPPVEGTWMGTLEAQQVEFPFAVTFDRRDGELRGEMDIIASMSPDIEVADVRVDGESVSFSLPFSGGESLRFRGRLSPRSLEGEAVYSLDNEVHGTFSVTPVPPEALPAWARGGETWSWPDTDRSHWPTKEWKTIDSADAGLDAEALSAASDVIRESFPAVRALLIARGGVLAHEEYFRGGSVNKAMNIKSASKGLISALVGVAIREGHLAGKDERVATLVPQYFSKDEVGKKTKIRLHHLLDMTSGLHWIENGAPTAAWATRGHSSGYYLSLPLECTPGECFNYSTASTHLLSEILMRQTGMTTRAFAERHVLDPIGLDVRTWLRGKGGVHIGGAEVFMTARDMARLGLLMSSQGVWDGREIIPAEWVRESVAYHAEGQPFVGSYGYGWWRRSIDGHAAFMGKGYGGQFIVVVPDSDLVVVVASDLSSPEMTPVLDQWICETLVPAAFPGKGSSVSTDDRDES